MARENFNDLLAFIAVAREQSFTRAAARLGVSQSGLSHTVRALETRVGLRLLTRTTRSVSTTEAGERLLNAISPRIDEINAELVALADLREKPTGRIRITANDHAVQSVLWPKLKPLLSAYPDVKIELTVDYGLTDIVAQRYDMGVRLGNQIARDMIAVRISPDLPMAIVGSPEYFAKRRPPQSPEELVKCDCITLRLPTRGGLYAWELQNAGRDLQVRVDGQLTFNTLPQMLDAALAGCGIAFVPEDAALPHIREGRLKSIMPDWCPTFPGYHAFYASRRQASRAMSLVIDTLRHYS